MSYLPGLAPPLPQKRSSKLVLRPYQREAVYGGGNRGKGILATLKHHDSALAILATGLGKSAIICEMANLARRPVLVLVDGDVLIDNAVAKLEEFTDHEVQVEQGAAKADSARIVVGSLDSVVKEDRLRRLKEFGFGLIIVDEAHQAAQSGYHTVFEVLKGAKRLGLTATPHRPDKKALPFVDKAYEYQLHEAQKDGWLCSTPWVNAKVKSVDFSGVHVRGGDLSVKEAQAIMGSEESLHGIVASTIEQVGDRPTIMFSNSIQNARAMAEMFNRYKGKKVAEFIDSRDMRSRNERRAIMAGFKRGEFQFFCNKDMLTMGYDAPHTAAIGMAAPTMSEIRFFQQVGRGTRGGRQCPVKGKVNCIILDYVNNLGRHTLITPAYVMAGKFGKAVQKIAARVQRESPEKSEEEIVRISREEYEAQREQEARRRKFIVAKVDYDATPIDPFSIIKAQRPNPFNYDNSGPVSAKQIERLEKWGMLGDIPKNCTKKMASKLILKERDRLVKGYASYKMCKWGLARGYNLRRVKRDRAKALFEAVKANGWQSIPPGQAAEILLNRQPGEDDT